MKRASFYYILLMFLFSACENKKKAETINPTEAPITEAIFASGHIEPAGQFVLTSINEGYLQKSLVDVNDLVKADQLLFIQDNQIQEIQEESALENLQIAKKNASEQSPILQQLYAERASVQQKLTNDSTQLARLRRLYTTNSVAKIDVDNAQLAYHNSLNNLQSIEERIQATRLELQQNLINSKSQYNTTARNSNYFSLIAPGSYRVYQIFKKQGELVRKGEAVALLGHLDSLLIVLSIDEGSIAKIQRGKKVLVELNTQKGMIYTANISKIYPYFEEATQSYRVEATFDNPPVNVIAGTLLQANIIIETKELALLIPRSSLNSDGKVLVKRANKIDTIQVKTGIVSTDWVEVLGGIQANDEVVRMNN